MANRLVECIPNFSEARRPEVVEQIIAAVQQVPGISILDRHSDLDHNRSVLTFVGDPESVEEAAYQAIATASQLIDLDQHHGEHPRIGATDVVPFVPISEVTMVECIEMARRLGKRVGSELQIPVYLYEDAATLPERQNLENIRSGQYEGLKSEIQNNPARYPDFGPPKLGKAGATVIGARQPLIAFNVYLTTDDVTIAQRIAKTMRNSSGGFRFVKALGLLVNGRAQVTMNLTNFRQSAIPTIVETIRNEARRYGVTVHSSELVGLIPEEALIETAAWYLQLDRFEKEQILEQKLFQIVANSNTPLNQTYKELSFIEDVAAGTPAPGGGSAAAHTAAISAALTAMVGRLTVGKKKYASVEQEMWKMVEEAEELKVKFLHAVVEDAEAFAKILEANRLPKATEKEQLFRAQAQEEASIHAASVPLENCRLCCQVQRLALQAISLGNINTISDGGSAAALARAAFTAAGMNVQINLLPYKETASAKKLLSELESLEKEFQAIELEIRKQMLDRGGITPYQT